MRAGGGIGGPKGEAHTVQTEMVATHGSQCGFCTPGFVVSMAVAHANGETDHDTTLAGNLCRCTGYAPIIRAAVAAESAPVPLWMKADKAVPGVVVQDPLAYRPTSSDDLAAWYLANPKATTIDGATEPGAIRTERLGTSVATHALAVAITIALRTPTLL